ncbi:hypothetical protein [Microbacterium sp. AR7-10]|nr:hypothetical protein [Microbacterium sp. AR7-10]
MSERYVVTSAAGEHVIRTDNAVEAARRAEQLRGTVIDRGVAS